jgi:hypothetical protein
MLSSTQPSTGTDHPAEAELPAHDQPRLHHPAHEQLAPPAGARPSPLPGPTRARDPLQRGGLGPHQMHDPCRSTPCP